MYRDHAIVYTIRTKEVLVSARSSDEQTNKYTAAIQVLSVRPTCFKSRYCSFIIHSLPSPLYLLVLLVLYLFIHLFYLLFFPFHFSPVHSFHLVLRIYIFLFPSFFSSSCRPQFFFIPLYLFIYIYLYGIYLFIYSLGSKWPSHKADHYLRVV